MWVKSTVCGLVNIAGAVRVDVKTEDCENDNKGKTAVFAYYSDGNIRLSEWTSMVEATEYIEGIWRGDSEYCTELAASRVHARR